MKPRGSPQASQSYSLDAISIEGVKRNYDACRLRAKSNRKGSAPPDCFILPSATLGWALCPTAFEHRQARGLEL